MSPLTRTQSLVLALAIPLLVCGCADPDADGPPEVRYGADVCDHCNMIISDERFAAATVTQGSRGPEPLLFDDYNCQRDHERANPGLVVTARWAHDHATRAWLPAEIAYFVRSNRIRSPMASNLAAFGDREAADRFCAEVKGEIVGHTGATPSATPRACCATADAACRDGQTSQCCQQEETP